MEEVLIVLDRSRRTQVAFYMGIFGFVSLWWLGQHLAEGIVIHGVLAPMEQAARDRILGMAHKGAFGTLGSFWLLAFRFYRKDRKKLLGY